MLLKRQQVLADAWAAYLKSNPSSDATAFRTAWMAARKSALTGSGLDPIFD
jgi:hypothetical protein